MTTPLPRHGGQARAIARQFGLAAEDLLDLSANINPAGPPPAAIQAMQVAISASVCLTQYPDLEESELKQALAAYAGVSREQVMVANGFVPLLDAALSALGIRSCLLPVPAFNEYRRVLEQNHVQITPALLRPELDFQYPFADFLTTDCEAILLANPQNPTGITSDRAALIDFVEQAARLGKYVLLDEAFIDYVPEDSLAAAIQNHAHLLIFRSLTKFFGMPGLRVAYALANNETARRIEHWLAPWPITSLASIAGAAAVTEQNYIRTTRDSNARLRAVLSLGLQDQGARVFSGNANFLFFKEPLAGLWSRLIVEHGIVLRSCDNYENLGSGFLRTAVQDADASARLLEALAALLGSKVS